MRKIKLLKDKVKQLYTDCPYRYFLDDILDTFQIKYRELKKLTVITQK